eukprot:6479981-Amphidinium_carterae.1
MWPGIEYPGSLSCIVVTSHIAFWLKFRIGECYRHRLSAVVVISSPSTIPELSIPWPWTYFLIQDCLLKRSLGDSCSLNMQFSNQDRCEQCLLLAANLWHFCMKNSTNPEGKL